ncbi:MAG: substrate-binding domain-containing protein [Meiothermus sp.]|nr:substrate-binding domain-containing protein [Meiothermus sp.]
MKQLLKVAALAVVALAIPAMAQRPIVGVSWSNFQEERWKTDEAAIKAALAAGGADYISADAQSSAEKQLTDIDSLIARGAKALIILAQDKDAIGPAIEKAKAAKIPVIGYDRLIEDPYAFYLTFDNVEVGRIMGRAVLAVRPSGNYVFIRGDPGDPNATFVYNGQREILEPAIRAGRIKIVGEQATEGWKPDVAQRNMEQLLTQNANRIDAVMSSNDGMATGSAAALQAVGLLGRVALSGQDGDQAALNRVALGQQTVSVWKDSRALGKAAGEIAVQLIKGTAPTAVTTGGVRASVFDGGPKKVKMNAILLRPVGITRNNLSVVLQAGWIKKEVLCRGVPNTVAACR